LEPSSRPRKTKIVCTLGPASQESATLARMMDAGMDVARLNFSHGDHASHARTLAAVRSVAQKNRRVVGVLQDLAGPKIRLGSIAAEERVLEPGEMVNLFAGSQSGDHRLPVNYAHLAQDLEAGESILLADGMVELKVEKVAGEEVRCRVVVGGTISSHKGVNLPTTSLRIPAFTEKDRADLAMGLAHGVDFVAMSFVRSSEDLAPVLEMINHAEPRPLLIAKIEKPQAVEHLGEILSVVDGVMVARGDLGVEVPLSQVPMIQKKVISEARRAGKAVITATQMLRSMIDNPRPTRAEAADVANAILDGTDAVMLSEESAVGAYPVEAVKVLENIALATEPSLSPRPYLREPFSHLVPLNEAALSRAACWLAEDLTPAAIVATTTSGSTARLIARFRSPHPVVGMSPEEATCRQLALSWGVLPAYVPRFTGTDHMFDLAKEHVKRLGIAVPGERIILTAGVPIGVPGTTNLLKLLDLD